MREQGYYWIKWNNSSEWEIVIYDHNTDRFKTTNGSWMQPSDVHEIDEKRITREK